MIEFHGRVTNGCLTFPPPQDALRGRWLSESEGKYVTERLFKKAAHKTPNQVRAYFGLAVMMIRERMSEIGWDICGVCPNKEMIHEILTKCCAGVGDGGEVVRLRDMTIEQAMKFFENVRAWAATQLALSIPDPDPNWRITGGGKTMNI